MLLRIRAVAATSAVFLAVSLLVLANKHAEAAGCQGVQLSSGQNVAAAIAANTGQGTTFCFAAGVYSVSDLYGPASGDTFDGSAGAILDGGGSHVHAFVNSHGVSNVTIRGFDIRHYGNSGDPEDGVVRAWGTGWVVEDNHIHDNGASGISVGTGTVVRGNLIDHNACGGVNSGYPAVNDLVQGNEISFNDYRGQYNPGWSCGGGKFVRSFGLRFVDNYSHDNTGHGFWLDGDNGDATVSGNRFEDNSYGGLLLEINDAAHSGPTHSQAGWGIKVTGNSFSHNGWGHANRVMFGAAIEVAATNHVEIAHNTIAASNTHAVVLNFTARSDSAGGDSTVHHISVHDNDIALREAGPNSNPVYDLGRVGFYTNDAPPAYHPSAVSFSDNRYYFDLSSAQHFGLSSPGPNYTLATWGQWRGAGLEAGSSISPASQFPSDDPTPTPSPSPSPSSPRPSPSPSPSPSRSPSPSSSPSPSPSPTPSRSPSPSSSPSPSPSPSWSPSPSSSPSPSPSPTPSRSPSPSPSPSGSPDPTPTPSESTSPPGSGAGPSISNLGAYPKNVRTHTTVSFDLSKTAAIWVRVQERAGRVVASLANGRSAPVGRNSLHWRIPRQRPAPGWYQVKITASDDLGNVATARSWVRVGPPPCARGRLSQGWQVGSPYPDCLLGTANADRINGRGRHDLVRAGAGDDLVVGGSGADLLHGGPGMDTIRGGPGDDTLYGGRGDDVLVGGPGRDVCYAAMGHDTVVGCEVVHRNRHA